MNKSATIVAIDNLTNHCDVDAELLRRAYQRASDGLAELLALLSKCDETDPPSVQLFALVLAADERLAMTKLGQVFD